MDTQRLRALQDFAHIEELLTSLVESLDFLPESTQRVFTNDLPPGLADLAKDANRSEGWCCWRAGERLWFYQGKISLPESRKRRRVVLQTSVFDADGNVVESGWWIRAESWRRLY